MKLRAFVPVSGQDEAHSPSLDSTQSAPLHYVQDQDIGLAGLQDAVANAPSADI